MKRFIGLLAALTLLCASASAEDAPKDFPLSAAECPVRLEDVVPLNASEIAVPDFVRYLPEDLPAITGAHFTGTTGYLALAEQPGFDQINAKISLLTHELGIVSVDGELSQTPYGRPAIRFTLPEGAGAANVLNSTLTAAYAEDAYEEIITARLSRDYSITSASLELTTADGAFLYQYDTHCLTGYKVDDPDGFFAGYRESGAISHAYVYTSDPARRYYFDGSGMLWELWDDESGITANYDDESGALYAYDVDIPVPSASDTVGATFSPYGTIISAYCNRAPAHGGPGYYKWSPADGRWYAIEGSKRSLLPDANTDELPDLSTVVPPLPALQMPEFRLDVSRVADLPQPPLPLEELPNIVDFRLEDGLITVTLDRPLTADGAVLRVLEEWEGGILTLSALSPGDGLTYTAPVSREISIDYLYPQIFFPAADASGFTCRACDLDDPDAPAWEVTLSSPAAFFRLYLTEDRRITEAQIGNPLSEYVDYCYLTFDEVTGELTEYAYYVEVPYDDGFNGWYQIFYVPGEGVTSAWVGEGEAAFYLWAPETGWTDGDGKAPRYALFDPLSFPVAFPFPAQP